VLDVTFREDDCRVRKDHAPQNLSTLRKFVLSLLRQDAQYPKRSLRSRRKTAERRPDYRASLLGLVKCDCPGPLAPLGGEGAPAGAGEGVLPYGAKRRKLLSCVTGSQDKYPALLRRVEQLPLLALPGHPLPPRGRGDGKWRHFAWRIIDAPSSTFNCTLPCPKEYAPRLYKPVSRL
jgi:hypothetical protein